ncbi:MAG TPA: FkbM family methyltransferase [Gaiellaceae bacterium]|jgi:FkbM family methyltransferase
MTLAGLVDYALNTLRDVRQIASAPRADRKPLLITELRLRARDARSRFTRPEPAAPPSMHTRMLGFDVAFHDYATLAYLFGEIFVHRIYAFESENPQPVIVDAGSNMGMAVLFFKRLYPHARVLAVEPEPTSFRLLEKNVIGNSLGDVRLVNAALGAADGEVSFFHQPGSLLASTRKERAVNDSVTVVRAATLSSLLDEPVDFLKLDVEGAEHDVLADLEQSGKLALIERMACEYHHHLAGEDRLGEFLHVLERSGFGYLVRSKPRAPLDEGRTEDLLVWAYRKQD